MKKVLSIITILTLLMPHASYAKVDKDVNVAKVQAMLAELCYKPGIVDGAWGKKTETAVKSFFAKHYRKYDGSFDVNDANFILSAGASAKAFGSASVKKCLVVYSDRIGNSLNNDKIKQITQKVANKKEAKKLDEASLEDSNVTIYKGWSIPDYVKPNPNLATLRHYFKKDFSLTRDPEIGKYRVKPKGNHETFKTGLKVNNFLNKQMSETSLLSYLYYENGKIIYDAKTPENRLGDLYNDKTLWLSNSVGKSIVSYVTGHAICEGYIDGINTKLDDWPLIENTLYHDQYLIDLLNMNAGDNKYIDDRNGMIGTGRWMNSHNIETFAERELKGSKAISKRSRKHHYNGLVTNLIMNYVVHKSDYDFQGLMNRVFQDKVKIQHDVTFQKNLFERTDKNNMTSKRISDRSGNAQYTFYASRFDYLRIGKAMLDDWQNNTCVGQYLKELSKNKIPQKRFMEREKGYRFSARSYAGQFHLDYLGLEGRNIFVMNGYGGQLLMVDFDKSRILAISSVTEDYDWLKLVLNLMRNGRLK